MPKDEILRRPSYGRKSPVVGERGARTRRHVIDVTLVLFADKGFHETSVDDIAKAAGVSRATLYQYFDGKDQLFVELLDTCGSAMMRVVRRLGALGPTAEGFDNLHWWLGEWAWVYDKYATMFAQWMHVDSSEASVKSLVNGFVEAYAERVSLRLEASGVGGVDRPALAAALLVVVHRFSYFRHRGGSTWLRDDELLDGLAVVVQLMLFPQTPPQVLVGHDLAAVPQADRPRPARRVKQPPTRFDHLSKRARRTVRQLLDAACLTFAARGYHSSNIDDVVSAAGVARGTFYKYFDDKLDLLAAVCDEARHELGLGLDAFARICPGPGQAEQLRSWLREFMPVHQRYGGVLRVWIEQQPDDPDIQRAGREAGRDVRAAFHRVLAGVTRPYPLSIDVAALVLVAILERVPETLFQREPDFDQDKIVEIVATMIERGLLGGDPQSGARGMLPPATGVSA